MPIWDYNCTRCNHTSERLVRTEDRNEQFCDIVLIKHMDVSSVGVFPDGATSLGGTAQREICSQKLVRTEISMPQRGKVDVRYKTKAILTDGTKVEGQFGRSERINKGSM